MKRSMIILAVTLIVALSYSMGEAAFFADSPFTSSYVEIIPNFDGFGDTAVITFESTDNLGSFFAFLIDPAGFPIATSATFGWLYLFADTLADGSLALYGSNTGFSNDWIRIF